MTTSRVWSIQHHRTRVSSVPVSKPNAMTFFHGGNVAPLRTTIYSKSGESVMTRFYFSFLPLLCVVNAVVSWAEGSRWYRATADLDFRRRFRFHASTRLMARHGTSLFGTGSREAIVLSRSLGKSHLHALESIPSTFKILYTPALPQFMHACLIDLT